MHTKKLPFLFNLYYEIDSTNFDTKRKKIIMFNVPKEREEHLRNILKFRSMGIHTSIKECNKKYFHVTPICRLRKARLNIYGLNND